MTRILFYRICYFGFFSWFIPFIISFLCYSSDGQLKMEYSTFKSIMIISGTVSGSYLLYLFFKVINKRFIAAGFIVGFSWLALNLILDGIILIPIMKISFTTYFLSIGLGYISIPAISISMGYLLNRKVKTDSQRV